MQAFIFKIILRVRKIYGYYEWEQAVVLICSFVNINEVLRGTIEWNRVFMIQICRFCTRSKILWKNSFSTKAWLQKLTGKVSSAPGTTCHHHFHHSKFNFPTLCYDISVFFRIKSVKKPWFRFCITRNTTSDHLDYLSWHLVNMPLIFNETFNCLLIFFIFYFILSTWYWK